MVTMKIAFLYEYSSIASSSVYCIIVLKFFCLLNLCCKKKMFLPNDIAV